MRIRFQGEGPVLERIEAGQPFLIAFFHGRQFLLINALRGWPMSVMTSISYLGEIQTRVVSGFGYTAVRGSSSRGGNRALVQMIRLIRKGIYGSFAVDGPRGPGGVVKPGVVFTARKLGIPIVPVTTSARPSLLFQSLWDRYLLPLPFCRGLVLFSSPWHPDSSTGEGTVKADCLKLAEILNGLERQADALIGRNKGQN